MPQNLELCAGVSESMPKRPRALSAGAQGPAKTLNPARPGAHLHAGVGGGAPLARQVRVQRRRGAPLQQPPRRLAVRLDLRQPPRQVAGVAEPVWGSDMWGASWGPSRACMLRVCQRNVGVVLAAPYLMP
jgi:hypothetical protein